MTIQRRTCLFSRCDHLARRRIADPAEVATTRSHLRTAVPVVPTCRSAALPPAVGRTRRQGPQRHRSLARARPSPLSSRHQVRPLGKQQRTWGPVGSRFCASIRACEARPVSLAGLLIVGGCIASACATSPHGEAAPCNGARTIVKVRSSRSSGGASTSARCRFSCATRSQRATPSSG